MGELVDARGLSCPRPVILIREVLRRADEVVTIVDNETACENVTRMAQKQGFAATVEKKTEGIYIHLSRQEQAVAEPEERAVAAPTAVLIAASTMGRGPEELGTVLVRAFLHTLNEVSPLPHTLVFMNSGVHLVVEGSPVVDDLRELVEQGVEVLACGTCLDYLGLKEKVSVGTVSNMYTIAETLLRAAKVVAL